MNENGDDGLARLPVAGKGIEMEQEEREAGDQKLSDGENLNQRS